MGCGKQTRPLPRKAACPHMCADVTVNKGFLWHLLLRVKGVEVHSYGGNMASQRGRGHPVGKRGPPGAFSGLCILTFSWTSQILGLPSLNPPISIKTRFSYILSSLFHICRKLFLLSEKALIWLFAPWLIPKFLWGPHCWPQLPLGKSSQEGV